MTDRRTQAFLNSCFKNPSNRRLFDALTASDLPNWVITSGCLFQTVWNVMDGNAPEFGIRDYDVFYYDCSDVGWESEDGYINNFNSLNSFLSAPVEVRNQARVHLWYEQKFACPYSPLRTVFEGIDRFLERVAMVGVFAAEDGSPQLYAPAGLDDVYDKVVRPTYAQNLPDIYDKKARRLERDWRDVSVVPWD